MKGSLVQLLLLGIIITTLVGKTTASKKKRQGTYNPLPEHCGPANGEKVFEDKELALQSYTWMALIHYGERSPNWRCRGSLISQRYVITSAFCADKRYSGSGEIEGVRLGAVDFVKNQACLHSKTWKLCAPPAQYFNAEQVIIHPSWNKRTNFSDDIALIRLDRPAELHGYVQPICLPPPDLDISAFLSGLSNGLMREAEVASYGYRSWGRVKIELPFVALEKCKYIKEGLVNQLLLVKGQLGLASYVRSDPYCEIDNIPAVYTDVAYYRNWIVSNLQP